MRFFTKAIAAALIALLATQPASAFLHRGVVSVGPGPVGIAQVGNPDITAQSYLNLFWSAGYGFVNSADVAHVDSFGWPVANLLGNISGQIGPNAQNLSSQGPWTVKWDAAKSCSSFIISGGTGSVINVGATTGIPTTSGSGGSNITINPTGTGACVPTAGSVVLNYASSTGLQMSYTLLASYTGWAGNTPNTGSISICRSGNIGWNGQDDCTAISNGTYWTTEQVQLLKNLHPASLRLMGWNEPRFARQSNEASWLTRGTTQNFSWGTGVSLYPGGNRSGGSSGLGTPTVTNGAITAAAANNTPLSGWQDGETIYVNMPQGVGAMQVSGAVSGTGGNVQLSILTVPATGTTHGTAIVDSMSTTTGIFAGQSFYGPDIPAGDFVTAINSGCTAPCVVLAQAATGSNVGESLTAGGVTGLVASNNIFVQNVSGTTEANGLQLINSVDSVGNTVTINTPFVHAYSGSGGRVAYQSLAITGKTGGSQLIFEDQGYPFNSNVSFNDEKAIFPGPATFIYSQALGGIIYNQGGTTMSVPREAQIQLANLVGADLWDNIPAFTNNDYATQAANLAFTNLNSNLKYYVEWDNENWNTSVFVHAQFSINAAANLGITGSLGGIAFQALRDRIIFGNLLPASNWSGSMSRVVRLACFQGGAASSTGITPSVVNQMQGNGLVSPGNAAYQAYVGGSAVNYNTFPNRPIDFLGSNGAICYAPYATGLGMQGSDSGYTITTFDAPNLIPIADATIAGNTATATAGIDALVRAGTNRVQTVTGSGTTFTTPLAHNFSVNDGLIFTVSGGTAYSGINTQQLYMVVSVPTSTTFTMAPMVNGVRSGTLTNAGSPGTGTMSVGDSPNRFSSIFTISQWEYTGFQNLAVNGFSPAPAGGPPNMYWYEGALELGGSPYTAAQYATIGMVTPSVPNVTTGTTHGTTVVDSLASVANTFPGEVASAADITASQTIVSVNSGCPTTCTGNYVVLSAVASGSNTGEPVTFTGTSALSVSNMATAINNWRLDLATSSATIQDYYNTFMGTQPGAITQGLMSQSVQPSNLDFIPGGQWSLGAAPNYVSPTIWGLFCGAQKFNGAVPTNGCP